LPQVFSLDQPLLLFAMMGIGGLDRSEGAVVGAVIVPLVDKRLIALGLPRIIHLSLVMIGVTVIAREGLMGAPDQFGDVRRRKSVEARAQRTATGGQTMPEEAAKEHDKQELCQRRFNKRLRHRPKTLITPERIAEHKADPLRYHSEAHARVPNCFRYGEMADKYVIHRNRPAQEWFRIMAVYRQRGMPPRVAGGREYIDIKDACHAILLLHLDDLLESLPQGIP
jgi:branched-chain amino acid transport system permease protein